MNEHQIAVPSNGPAAQLKDMHPGNRFRLMFGLPLLPEPDPKVKFPDKANIPFLR